ncbi:PP2C family protein-serine/threonine phosphatase [Actinoalloteichus hymeniacidonis]|uniref:Serine/threonine protein phosphatase PstP n=1 Tax=Actinoalloteichus hymeniacidonis TaxID=340345 RepID=A0AAC9HK83_9PSEU|nr:protein phosphatase 2C domain-containing protein [Actinoalloteichus hymeniacidonis]AOS60878.1 serine/threonine protein phosphatase [Actinoalloteichus hymeniacidonis]MBB5911122.1 protein phosphatase [Actinoalloteichus hymeniacidonis]
MTLVLRYAARSDRGLVRSNNQDSVYAGPRLLALADGMGGHAAGEVASKVVIAALAPLDDDEPGDDLLGRLREAVSNGNGMLNELVAGDPDLDGMGTTLTAVLFAGSRLGLVHVGDSRAYLLRDGRFAQITHDDTFVQSLIDEGRISEEDAANHPQRSLLLRALTGNDVELTLTVREARPGDRYLLCSDGLSGPVSDETLDEAMRISDPQACADRMIELALKGGGPDNVTCIVADVVDVEFGENAPIVGGAAGDGSEEPPPPDSAAARASATTLPRPPRKEAEPEPTKKKRKGLRTALVLFAVLVLLGVGGYFGYSVVMGQYFVGANDDDEVAVFQGVRGTVVGIPLHRQVEDSCGGAGEDCERIQIGDLRPAYQGTVRDGIVNQGDLNDARETIDQLRTEQLLPPCTEEQPASNGDNEPADNDDSANSAGDTEEAEGDQRTPEDEQTRPTPPSEGPSGLVGQDDERSDTREQDAKDETTGGSAARHVQEPGVDCRTVG